jgi:hypothetical protein
VVDRSKSLPSRPGRRYAPEQDGGRDLQNVRQSNERRDAGIAQSSLDPGDLGHVVKRAVLAVVTAVVLAALVGVPRASAEALAPWWGVTSGSRPTNLMPGQPGRIVVTAQNRGDGATSGEVTISDALPAGVEAVAIEGIAGEGTASSGPVSCTLQTLICTFSGSLLAYEEIEVDIAVSVHADAASGERNTASVSGGGVAGTVTASHPIEVDDTEKFGVEDYELIPENLDGSVDTQAGSHPFQLTTVMTFNSKTPDERGRPRTVALAKDIVAELPAGFLADPAPLAQCTDEQFSKQPPEQTGQNTVVNECPAQSAVGVATVTFNEPNVQGFNTVTTPIFNMTPLAGEPARFGFKPLGIIPAFLDASVRTGGDYGVTLTASDLTEVAWLLSVKLTFWGVPGARSHDGERGWECLKGFGTCPVATATGPPVLLTMPTSCEAPFQSTIRGDSWGSSARAAEQAEPVTYSLRGGPGESPSGEGESLSLDGCDHLPFAPSVEVSTDVSSASAPTGLTVDVHVPQPAASTPEALAESSARDITLALPAGVTLNPAGANGLEACSESQIGFTGFGELDPTTEPSMRTALFTPALPEPLDPGLNFCPDASKVGTVKLQTPILPNALEGAVYLAAENANPYGSLTAIYILARDPVSGTLVKLPGNLSLNQATGQITVMFESTPSAALRRDRTELFRRRTGAAGNPGALRLLHDRRVVHALVGKSPGSGEIELCDHRRSKRWAGCGRRGGWVTVSRGEPAVRAIAEGRDDEHRSRVVQPVDGDARPRRRPAGPGGLRSAPTPWSLGDARERPALPGSPGQRRNL